ncbi:RusA family crossover junction endodeoxyribonuclease [Nocardioides sp. Arc9.136]|uniref:RusA family crossover junction endodeoxyribonuclease n=1 Tax=Nocardioides sp. Arc9.136 TaxID=2996826 RepID=UPI0026660841|nr:RusA family crossover junction endodeoxyribonuclease [Nocardioides sp. Arc9.136]WKN47123.1 RusA family crossover junction endodeoxyribonuclease [Nocardioides sp. Arc9.136]
MTTTAIPGRLGIRVLGLPIPQGSKTAVTRKGRPALIDANAATLAPWRDQVKLVAEDTCRYHDTITGPVRVWVRFTFERPPSHYRTGRNAHLLKDSAPRYPGRACGDVDKLQRAVFDALTDAAVWADDTQVVDVRARKFYASEDEVALPQAGVDIVIEEIA